jgi:hypothetical protein
MKKYFPNDQTLPEASGAGRAGVPELVPLRGIPEVLAIGSSYAKIKTISFITLYSFKEQSRVANFDLDCF